MDKLSSILANLSHLNLEGKIVDKQPFVSGLGGSCDVYAAWSTKHDKKVAVKQIRTFLAKEPSFAKKLAREIRIWSELENENVLPLLGYFTEGDKAMPSLVSEWMKRGTLYDFMKSFPRGGFETCTILRDIASGLAYLHSKEVIHADLKTANILMSASKTPLLADFGLSLTLSHSRSTMGTTTTSAKGTVRWMAIELLPSVSGDEPLKHDEKSYMWAFGMIIYGLLSWEIPYKNKRNDALVTIAIMNGEVPEKPVPPSEHYPSTFDPLWAVASSCWVHRNSRPTAREAIHYVLNGIFDTRVNPRSFTKVMHRVLHSTQFNTHMCCAELVESEFSFSCEPKIGRRLVQSVSLTYTPVLNSDQSRSFPFAFEIIQSHSVGDSGILVRQFLVENIADASEWVRKFEMIPNIFVSEKHSGINVHRLILVS